MAFYIRQKRWILYQRIYQSKYKTYFGLTVNEKVKLHTRIADSKHQQGVLLTVCLYLIVY